MYYDDQTASSGGGGFFASNLKLSENTAGGHVQQQQSADNYPSGQMSYGYTAPFTRSYEGYDASSGGWSGAGGAAAYDLDDPENEAPLLEELGIYPDHILQKTFSVLNPLKVPPPDVVLDCDLAGPLLFCLVFGALLLLQGKLHFGYIYGIGAMGCIGMYMLLNLMSDGVSLLSTVSILGYCLLPLVLLSAAGSLGLDALAGSAKSSAVVTFWLTLVCVVWCSFSASKLFVNALRMEQQQLLVAYPCALFYGVFSLLTVF